MVLRSIFLKLCKSSPVRRIQQHIRQDDLGSMIDCSHKFIGDVEKGKTSVECGRVFRLLNELGIKVHLDLPDDIADELSL